MTHPTSRRSALKLIAAGLAAPAIESCTRALPRADGFVTRQGVRFVPVRVSSDRVIRRVVGLRPFRRTGFRVEADRLGEKVLVHNYGHGGGGVSLSWGSAELAARIATEAPHRSAAVIGCGVIGLSTARLLQDRGFTVTIYTRDLPPNTTSNIAGAQWTPFTVADEDKRTSRFDEQYVQASRFAYRYFQTFVGRGYGVTWRENYFLRDPAHPPEGGVSWERRLLSPLLDPRPLAASEHPFRGLEAGHYVSMHIEPTTYLPSLLRDFRLAGGHVVVRELPDRATFASLAEPLVMNCTGLDAGKLFGDQDVLPIKGQLTVLAPQDDVNYNTIGPTDIYMFPRADGIALGGTHERGVWTMEPSETEHARILREQGELFARFG